MANSSGLFYMDIINANLDKVDPGNMLFSINEQNKVFHSKSQMYPFILGTVKDFFQKHPEARHVVPGNFNYIKYGDEHIQKFCEFAHKRIKDHLKSKKKARESRLIKKRKRHSALHDDDIFLSENFYKRHGIDLTSLCHKGYGEFIANKDCSHATIYGNVKRFDKIPDSMKHEWITRDKKMGNAFVKDLQDLYKKLIAEMNTPIMRHNRQHYRENCDK